MRGGAGALAVGLLALVGATSVWLPPDRTDEETLGGSPRLRSVFVVRCAFTHRAPDDPIVAPGQVRGSHLHDFFGNFTVDTTSTLASLLDGDARCTRRTDRSGYWVPTLFDEGRAVVPIGSRLYYGAGGKLPDSVQAPPNGLVVVAGGTGAPEAVRWGCSDDSVTGPAPRDCGDAWLELTIRFPDCWDGERLDAPDHRSHLVHAASGRCPAGHPVPITTVRFVVRYPVHDGEGVSLSSGDLATAHGDLFVAWHRATFERLVARCINRRAC